MTTARRLARSRGPSRSSTSSRSSAISERDLFGWTLRDAAPTVFSFGVFGLIPRAIMLFFPRGLLPLETLGSSDVAQPMPVVVADHFVDQLRVVG